MRRGGVGSVFLVAMSLLVAGCAGSSAAPAGGASSGDGVPVSGRVIDDQFQPVGNATVSFLRPQNLSVVHSALTGADGGFAFPGVVEADYVVNVQAPGYDPINRVLTVRATLDLTKLSFTIKPTPIVEPYYETVPKTLTIQYGVSYAVGGDFNRGCVYEGVTCQAIAYPNPNVNFFSDDPKRAPLQTIVLEEVWTSTSPVCAKTIAIDLYNPDAPSTSWPNPANPHYWTNYPHETWKDTSPVHMVIPRNDSGNADSIDDPARLAKNDGVKLTVKGNWTARNFPPGKGLTNLPVDVNCFTDQKFSLYWSSFYLEPAPLGFQARPE